MSELRSIVVTVCCVVGFILLLGGFWTYNYGKYVNIYSEKVCPYRVYSVPFVIFGIALLVAGIMVYVQDVSRQDISVFGQLCAFS